MRKIIHIFLSLVIVYAGTVSAYANTSVGGWSAVDVITAGATNTINATKTAGGKLMQSAVTVAPSAVKVGKHLIKGGGVAALALAVPQLLGDAVDWVLDPANNSVTYTDPNPADGSSGSNIRGTFTFPISGSTITGTSLSDICQKIKSHYDSDTRTYIINWSKSSASNTSFVCNMNIGNPNNDWKFSGSVSNPSVTDPSDNSNKKYLPIETVAAQVISNAEAGDPSSQEAVKATALDGFAAGEHDAALESAATEADTDAGTDNPTDPNNPTDPQDPAAPFDPSSIIAAINALKALLAGILSSITGLSDLFNDTPPEKTQEETDVPVEAPPEVKNPNEFDVDYIGFSSQCPTLSPFSVGIGGASSTMTFDMTPLCNLAVTIRPAIIAIAYFIGLGVIASAIRET